MNTSCLPCGSITRQGQGMARAYATTTKEWQKMNIKHSILDLIGNTPVVRLNSMTKGCHGIVAAKLESFQPMNSVKDRAGLAMIEFAEAHGWISPGKTVLVEATSGNTGIALAYVAAVKGSVFYPILFAVMPLLAPCSPRVAPPSSKIKV